VCRVLCLGGGNGTGSYGDSRGGWGRGLFRGGRDKAEDALELEGGDDR